MIIDRNIRNTFIRYVIQENNCERQMQILLTSSVAKRIMLISLRDRFQESVAD